MPLLLAMHFLIKRNNTDTLMCRAFFGSTLLATSQPVWGNLDIYTLHFAWYELLVLAYRICSTRMVGF